MEKTEIKDIVASLAGALMAIKDSNDHQGAVTIAHMALVINESSINQVSHK